MPSSRKPGRRDGRARQGSDDDGGPAADADCSFKNTTDMMVTKREQEDQREGFGHGQMGESGDAADRARAGGEKTDDPQRPVGRLYHIQPAVIALADEG